MKRDSRTAVISFVALSSIAFSLIISCNRSPLNGPVTRPSPLTAIIGPSPSTTSQTDHSPIRPDPQLTLGDVLDVTKDDICVPGYSKKVRDVPKSVKEQVYTLYGIVSHEPGEYEVDHLISLELGGSNSIKNLWPESYRTAPWNAHVKDKIENKLHRMICSGQIDIPTGERNRRPRKKTALG